MGNVTCPDCAFQCKVRPLAAIKIKARVEIYFFVYVSLCFKVRKQLQMALLNLLT